jgi:hypothetical protein
MNVSCQITQGGEALYGGIASHDVRNTRPKRTTKRSRIVKNSGICAAEQRRFVRRLPGQGGARSRPRQLPQEEARAHRARRRARRRGHGCLPENEGGSGQVPGRLLLLPRREIRQAQCRSLKAKPAMATPGADAARKVSHKGETVPRDPTRALRGVILRAGGRSIELGFGRAHGAVSRALRPTAAATS